MFQLLLLLLGTYYLKFCTHVALVMCGYKFFFTSTQCPRKYVVAKSFDNFDKKQTHNADMVQRYDNIMHLKHFLKLHAQLQFLSAYVQLSREDRIEGYPSNTTLYHHHVFRV